MDKHLDHFEVRWKNFKGFKDTGWVKIKPITIILGPNNSGKSNFLAPLLLMNQTVTSRDSYSPLILKGDVYDAGNYQEIVKDYITENDIQFGYRYHLHENDEELDPLGADPPGAFEATFGVESKYGDVNLKKTTIYDVYKRKYLSLTRLRSGKYKYEGIGADDMTKWEKESISKSKPVNFAFSPNVVLPTLEAIQDEHEDNEELKRKSERFSEGFSVFLRA
ncbi:MAG: AAA family ATPase, partial [Cyclobacteriaceae bacterium]